MKVNLKEPGRYNTYFGESSFVSGGIKVITGTCWRSPQNKLIDSLQQYCLQVLHDCPGNNIQRIEDLFDLMKAKQAELCNELPKCNLAHLKHELKPMPWLKGSPCEYYLHHRTDNMLHTINVWFESEGEQ